MPVGATDPNDVQLFDTGQLLLAHLLRRAGEILPGLEETSTADREIDGAMYINHSYWKVCGLHPWRFNRKSPPAQFLSVAKDAVTVNSIVGATVTLSATIAATRAGRKFFLDSEGVPHRILAHTAGSAVLTLATSYSGTLTSGAGTIFQDELTVASDILAFPSITDLSTGLPLRLVSEQELRERAPRPTTSPSQTARLGAFITESVLRIAPWTDTARLFECAYNYRPDPLTFNGVEATDTPIVPRQYRAVIAWDALATLLVDRRQLDKAKAVRETEVAPLIDLMQRSSLTFSKPRVFVRPGQSIGGRWR